MSVSQDNYLLYFAYGVDMNPEHIAARCDEPQVFMVAHLPDHALAFFGYADKACSTRAGRRGSCRPTPVTPGVGGHPADWRDDRVPGYMARRRLTGPWPFSDRRSECSLDGWRVDVAPGRTIGFGNV
ncbi:gamma-glutamylcyclotransferase family protein [Azorhizophilus paspali]|uniref:Gamma-glutamylcyclotransferase family protein n=1 Tax=Azorhizophilus paspali TaxID=69963 RepID=A0ABV6SKU5_AZOPA